MKKCASCTKDLPDAALHCVFCGAKQPPAPASPQGLAKTVMGYSASEMIEQLKQQGAAPAGRNTPPPVQSAPPAQAPPFHPTPAAALQFAPPSSGPLPQVQAQQRSGPSSAPPYAQPSGPAAPPYAQPSGPAYAATAAAPPNAYAATAAAPPNAAPYAATAAAPPNQPFLGNSAPTAFAQPSPFANPAPLAHTPQPGGHAPASHAAAKTVMAPAANFPNQPASGPNPGNAAGPGQGGWSGSPNVPPASYGGPMNSGGGNASPYMQSPAVQVSPAAVIPASYAGSTAARAGRPIEPWKDSLRMVMLVWGAVLLAAFATPTSIDPLTGNWNVIADGAGMAKIIPIVLAAVGLISVIFSSVPMSPAPRGFIATLLGLSGFMLPYILAIVNGASFEWQPLTALVSLLLLIPGLLVRQQYRDALLPRLLVTFGALAYLALHLVPVASGDIPLVGEFTAILDAEGLDKVTAIVKVFPVLIVVLSLLVWLPAPAPGGANLWALTLLLWPLIAHLVQIGLHIDGVADAIKANPNATVFGDWIEVPFLAILSFGLATILGKRLE